MQLSEAITLLGQPFAAAAPGGPSPGPGGIAVQPPARWADLENFVEPSSLASPRSQPSPGPLRWADLGCGSGLFTWALAHFLPHGSSIFAIDLQPTLKAQTTPNGVSLVPRSMDFVQSPLGIDNLDGILMANSLHYVQDKPALLQKLKTSLRPVASLVIVEYDISRPVRTWVPYPIPFTSLETLLQGSGWSSIQRLGERPSAYGRGNLYAAVARRT